MGRSRSASLVASVAILSACAIGTLGCVGSAPREPTLPTVNFTPRVIIEVDDDRVSFSAGPRAEGVVRFDPASVPSGSVGEVMNGGDRDHRLQGNDGKVFDTGTVRPGERTTVVLVNAGADDLQVVVTDPRDPKLRATIIVRPRAPGSS